MPYTIAIDARKVRDFGIGTYVRNLVRELADIDRENTYLLLVGSRGREALEELPENFETIIERSPVYSIRELVALSWKLTRANVDLYHATHYVLPAFLPCRTVVTIHDIIHLLYPQYLPNRLAFYYAERMIRRSLNRGQRIISVSKNTRKDLIKYFNIEGSKIEVVHNGIEEVFHTSLESDDRQRRLAEVGLGDGQPYLLFVGNPKPHKNLDRVVQAYSRALRLHDFPHSLVCVGDREGMEFKIRQRAEQLGIGDRIVLLGHVDQDALPAIYQGAALFLYPTLYEGFGLPVVEAMASNVPVITSNTSALKEIAAGYADLVNPLDVEAMAAAIVSCISDPDHGDSLRKLGRRRARDFSWKKAAKETHEIYMQVIEGVHPSATKDQRQGGK